MLHGDGTWSFVAEVIGDDIVVKNVKATWFGGSNDPQDDGRTASGISTRNNPHLIGCSLPMNGLDYPHLTMGEHAALDGSPIPRIPWHTLVEVTYQNQKLIAPVIDIGPAKRTRHALDLTQQAFRQFEQLGVGVITVDYRVLGGAKFVV